MKTDNLEREIGRWREDLTRRGILKEALDELEDHLSQSIEELRQAGLTEHEALMVGFDRLGRSGSIGAEFSRLHAGRVWRQTSNRGGSMTGVGFDSGNCRQTGGVRKLCPAATSGEVAAGRFPLSPYAALLPLAAAQFLVSQIPQLTGVPFSLDDLPRYLQAITFIMFPFLALYFALRRRISLLPLIPWIVFSMVALTLTAGYRLHSPENSQTVLLSAIHLPLLFWLLLLPLYTGLSSFHDSERQLDFIRFTGEAFLYGVLVLCGIFVTALTVDMLFGSIGIVPGQAAARLLAVGIIPLIPLTAAMLVEAKGHLIENFAPVLARIFLPIFLAVMGLFLLISWSMGKGIGEDRDMLIAIDLLLTLVLAMILYSASIERDEVRRSGWDVVILCSAAAALIIDASAMAAISERFIAWGVTPNRLAAAGENLLLSLNLLALTILHALFLGKRIGRSLILKVQGLFLALYAAWFLTVALVLPPLFGFR